MDPLTITAGIMSLLSAGSSIFGGLSGKSAAKEAAADEAKMEGIVTQAKIEDLKVEERALRGQTIAGAAGSGVKVDKGSPLEVLAEQARSFTRERQTVARVGATRAANARTQGKNIGNQAAYQGFSQGISSFGNAFSMFAQAR